jgi:ATP-dependent DNA helicase 2 subunit 2
MKGTYSPLDYRLYQLIKGARQPIDDLPIDESFSPLLHRIESAVRYRAVHPNDPVLDPSERLTEFAHPSEDMVKNSKSHLEKLMSVADVKKGNPNFRHTFRRNPTHQHIFFVL